ncbi:RNA recognition motif-containing protein [Aspergillus flavus]|nr:RNA recognition motif-containing protein [Aspergillus flavus]RAQ72678.1 RNA recognition motif-containing protein [Aspergillus flavus]
MPPLPGEERALTVFADIHYYFTAPTPKPLHHRFDKGSYLYLYHNAVQRKTRIEVANNPGTRDQDAFNGALDQVYLRHSTQFPTLCTLIVDGRPPSQGAQAFPPPANASPHEWLLPSTDPRGEDKELRLHTLDIYFWTSDDADNFLNLMENYLSPPQIETDRHPYPPPPQASVSTVVQQLENVAITDPAYQNGQTRNSQSESTPSSPPPTQTFSIPSNLPPPPPLGGPPTTAQKTTNGTPPATEERNDPAQYTPLPYNPAAPAAPEPIQVREKTPFPIDGGDGTGLAAAAAVDSGAPFTPPSQITGGGGFASPPTSQGLPYTMPGSYASPPPSAGLTHSGSFSSRSSIQSPPSIPSYTPSFLAGVGGGHQSNSHQPVTMSFAPPPKDPNAHLYGQTQNLYGGQPQIQPASPPPPPIGGYSNYSYDKVAVQQPVANDYDIHRQLYRPTEAEVNSHSQKIAQKSIQNPGRPRNLEERAHRMESSVNRFLKKLEKKI